MPKLSKQSFISVTHMKSTLNQPLMFQKFYEDANLKSLNVFTDNEIISYYKHPEEVLSLWHMWNMAMKNLSAARLSFFKKLNCFH